MLSRMLAGIETQNQVTGKSMVSGVYTEQQLDDELARERRRASSADVSLSGSLQARVDVKTMRELNQETANVIRVANEENCSVAITRRGRFIALINPLANAGIEGKVIEQFLGDSPEYDRITGMLPARRVLRAQAVADDLDIVVDVRAADDRDVGKMD